VYNVYQFTDTCTHVTHIQTVHEYDEWGSAQDPEVEVLFVYACACVCARTGGCVCVFVHDAWDSAADPEIEVLFICAYVCVHSRVCVCVCVYDAWTALRTRSGGIVCVCPCVRAGLFLRVFVRVGST